MKFFFPGSFRGNTRRSTRKLASFHNDLESYAASQVNTIGGVNHANQGRGNNKRLSTRKSLEPLRGRLQTARHIFRSRVIQVTQTPQPICIVLELYAGSSKAIIDC